MKEFKGTQGEFNVVSLDGTYKIINHKNICIAECLINKNKYMCPLPIEALSNAKLIAAPPDLLEALQHLVYLNDHEENETTGIKDWHEAFGRAEKAISKALD